MAKTHIRAELVALADYAMTGEDKKLSVIGIFDKLFIRQLPGNHARMSFVVTFVGASNTEDDVKLKIIAPSGKEDFAADVKLSFGENGKFNFVSNFEGFPFNEIGTYRFVFEDGKTEIVSYELDVIQVKDETGKKVAN
jgi:hypothetical protein